LIFENPYARSLLNPVFHFSDGWFIVFNATFNNISVILCLQFS